MQNQHKKQSVAFWCTSNQQPKNDITKAILFKVTLKIIACLGKSLRKYKTQTLKIQRVAERNFKSPK